MADHRKRDQWLQDVRAGQRNIVFPDTVENETRCLAVLAISVFSFLTAILVATYYAGTLWLFLLGMVLFCGSIFGTLAWATRRSLRRLEAERRNRMRKRA